MATISVVVLLPKVTVVSLAMGIRIKFVAVSIVSLSGRILPSLTILLGPRTISL